MKKLRENYESLLMSLCEVAVGILLLIKPASFTSFIIITLGVILTVRGIMSIIAYFRATPEVAAREHNLSSGVIYLAIGLFAMFRSGWFIAAFPVLTFLYGIMIMFAGLIKIQWVADCIRLKKKQWVLELISAALSLACAAVIIKNPFSSTVVLWTFTAVSLIVEAVFDMVAVFFEGRK